MPYHGGSTMRKVTASIILTVRSNYVRCLSYILVTPILIPWPGTRVGSTHCLNSLQYIGLFVCLKRIPHALWEW